MSIKHAFMMLCGIALLTGCRPHGLFVKRESELNCPTDIRKTVPWCAGEDAVFRCPCGPNEQFHGHKPTCWRLWQASGTEWRDMHCEPLCSQCETDACGNLTAQQIPQPFEVLEPTDVGPTMPLEGGGLKEEPTPENSFPFKEESLPRPEETPQQLEVPSDEQSYLDTPQLPWNQSPSNKPIVSLTDYFHQIKQENDRAADKPAFLGQAKSAAIEPELATEIKVLEDTELKRPKVLPPVDEEKKDLELAIGKEQTQQLVVESQPIEHTKTVTELKVTQADPDRIPSPNQMVVKQANHLEKQRKQTLQKIAPKTQPAIEQTVPAKDIKSELLIITSKQESITQESPTQKVETRKAPQEPSRPLVGLRSPRMLFVR